MKTIELKPKAQKFAHKPTQKAKTRVVIVTLKKGAKRNHG